jgi:hypothetical protein
MLPNEAIPSCRVKLFILPAGQNDSLPLGLCEDFSGTKQIASENFRVVGHPVVPDNVSNTEEARFRWGKVHQVDEQLRAAITPTIREWASFKPFNLLALDPIDNTPIAMLVGCRPDSLDFNARGGTAARQNYTGIARYMMLGDEVQQAAAA